MSLLRLLKAGRSLVNPKESGSRYRMHERIQLPKFGSSKNPFSARSETPAVLAAPGAIDSEPTSKRELSPAEEAAARLKQTVRLPPALPVPQLARAGEMSRAWWNPLTWWKSGSGGGGPGLRTSEPAVQGELSLDQVKVVRNDLSDSDVEVVQPSQAVKPGGKARESEPDTAMEEAPRV